MTGERRVWASRHEIVPANLAGYITYPWGGSDLDENAKIRASASSVSGLWSANYKIINAANGVLKQIAVVSDDEFVVRRKNDIVAFNALTPEVQNSALAADLREDIATRQRVKPGMPAPDFNLAMPDGSRLSLSDLRGKYVVLDLWASWCRPCRASFLAMKEIYAKYKDKGLEILGVTNDSREEDWLKALEQDWLPWKQVIDEFPIKYKPAKVATL